MGKKGEESEVMDLTDQEDRIASMDGRGIRYRLYQGWGGEQPDKGGGSNYPKI